MRCAYAPGPLRDSLGSRIAHPAELVEAAAPERRTFASTDPVLAAVILGNDAVVSARPGTAAQLANACTAAGFDLVVPPTWGDELVAITYLEQLAGRDEHVIVGCACPRVAELLARGPNHAPAVSLAAPPVAVARALRRIYSDAILITYVGDCPSSADSSIDVRFSPAALFAQLERQGVAIADQSSELDPRHADRWRRYASIPGGLPALRFLGRAPVERVLRTLDAAPFESGAIAPSRANVLIDLARAARCECGGDRDRIEDCEPARSMVPVVRPPSDLVMGPDPTPARTRAATPRGTTRLPMTVRVGASLAPAGVPVAPAASVVPSMTAPSVAPPPIAPPPIAPKPRELETPPMPAAASAAGRGVRRGVLLAVPAVVLVAAAALGVAVYRGGAVATTPGSDTAASRSADSSSSPARGVEPEPAPLQPQPPLPGAIVAPGRAQSNVPVVRDSGRGLLPPTVQPPGRGARGAVPDSAGVDSAARARTARRRAPRPAPVVPGWLPQGRPAFSPTDSAARRPDSSGRRAPPDTARPPA